jgi:ArsR family transcriptional regulator
MAPSIEIDCVAFCKALADETRQTILQILLDGEKCVSDLTESFSMSQPTISHHLNILKSLGLVVSRKDGKNVYYDINRDNVIECCGMLITKFSDDSNTVTKVECES